MPYTCDLSTTINAVDLDAWRRVQGASGDPFMDPRFLRAVERSMTNTCKFWHLIVRDQSGDPVACASLSMFRVDLTVVAATHVKRFVERLRRAMPSLLRLKVLFCGIPVSTGQRSLAIVPTADYQQVLAVIDQNLRDFATRERAMLICYKEFSHQDHKLIKALEASGYLCAQTPPMHYFPSHSDFPTYLASLRSHYRYDIKRSMRKAERAGVMIVRLEDPDAIQALYGVELHALYTAVVEQSAHQLEKLPVEFFHELVRCFPQQVGLTVATVRERVVAFNWSLHAPPNYYLLFCGIDYQENSEADLYFNLMFAEIAQALGVKAAHIQMGQTADSFKARLGCTQRPRYICVKSRYRTATRGIKACARFLLPPVPPVRVHDIYRTPPPAPRSGSRL